MGGAIFLFNMEKSVFLDRCGWSFSAVVIDFLSIFSLRGLIIEPYFTKRFFLNFHFDTYTNLGISRGKESILKKNKMWNKHRTEVTRGYRSSFVFVSSEVRSKSWKVTSSPMLSIVKPSVLPWNSRFVKIIVKKKTCLLLRLPRTLNTLIWS